MNHSPHRDEQSHNNNQFKSESSVRYNLISEVDESSIKREPNASDQNENEFDLVGNYHHDNNNHHDDSDVKREIMNSSKKTMNNVLKLLTNKMRGSSINNGRKGATEQDFESKMWVWNSFDKTTVNICTHVSLSFLQFPFYDLNISFIMQRKFMHF